jgi:O-antigen ligase
MGIEADVVAAWGTVAAGIALGVLRPRWLLPILLVACPLRVGATAGAEIATLLLVGAALGRSPAIAREVRVRPEIVAALLLLPIWMLTSGLWARQPWFAVRDAGKWFAVALAALLALADPRRDPKPLVLGACLALLPSALWALGERLGAIAPVGNRWELELRIIVAGDLVRGRALFYHPNRLAEFTEQIGLLLAACAVAGPWRAVAGAAALLAAAGSWASGSAAGMATMIGGGVLTVAAVAAWRLGAPAAGGRAGLLRASGGLGRAVALLLPAAGVAAVVAAMAWQMHGGIGPRSVVYRKAWDVILRHPILGLGGGGWAFEVSTDPVGRFWFASHTHSLPLQVWVELGLVGLVLAVGFFAVPLWAGLRAVARGPLVWQGVVAGACAGVIGLLAHDLVHYFLRQAADGIPTGLLLGLAAGSLRRASTGPAA